MIVVGGATTPAPPRQAISRAEGRLFGGLVLAAFLLYGIGSSMPDEPIGLILVGANSVAVTIVGVIGHRLVRHHHPGVGTTYLVTRIAEAILLGGGVALFAVADQADADTTGYLLAMVTLGVGSVPFWWIVGRGEWLSNRFALWGVTGYVALATGAVLELITGRSLTVVFAVPGGLFELAVGLYLLRRGFEPVISGSDGD